MINVLQEDKAKLKEKIATMEKHKNIVQLDEMRPHLVIPGVKSMHVIPTAVFDKIVNGTMKAVDVDDIDDFLPTIISEWLRSTRQNASKDS